MSLNLLKTHINMKYSNPQSGLRKMTEKDTGLILHQAGVYNFKKIK
jgi:hypothetical protein